MADLGKLPQPGAPCLPMGVTDPQGKGAFTLRFGTATNEAVKTGTVAGGGGPPLRKVGWDEWADSTASNVIRSTPPFPVDVVVQSPDIGSPALTAFDPKKPPNDEGG
jgi:hypothetical protein